MQNLRIKTVQVVDSTSINVTFTHDLTPHLSTTNILIVSETENSPSSDALKIKISGADLNITCQPLTPYGAYYLTFQSTPSLPFMSLNGEAKLLEDGVSNKYLIMGPLPSDNPIKNYLFSFLRDNIYNIDDTNTLVNKYLQSLSVNLSKALYDIGLVKNENYLSVDVVDERQIRGKGPFDRLLQEGAYQLVRVGRTPSGTSASLQYSYSEFPRYPITIQKQTSVETLHSDSVNETGKFNVNDFILNLSSGPVTRVNSIVFTINSGTPTFTYDITTLGYQIKDSRYDQDYASTYYLLTDNQIKLNEAILTDPTFEIDKILSISVSYEYKNLGIIADASSVNVYTSQDIIRETLPPIINVFNLKHAPIINSDNTIPTLNGITFSDPNNNLAGAKHPAFLTEIPFRLNALPSYAGQYSIDYNTGTVYVYGADLTRDGTGPYPPLASYKYRYTYQPEIDYVYDSDLLELVALPNGSLVGYAGTISFDYEEVLVPGVDYSSALHKEELTERADNRLVALNVVKTINQPITNVFRVYNETSGEIYNITRWNDNKIYYQYQNPPRTNMQNGERASFADEVNEMLFVNSTLTNTGAVRIFKILLNNNTLIAATEDGIGYAFNSSVKFSNSTIFATEKWFNRQSDVSTNIEKLVNIGEYMVDYVNGIIYCAVSSTQDNIIGYVTYKKNIISPEYPHLITVNDIYYSIGALNAKSKTFEYLSFDDGEIIPQNLDFSDELILNNTSTAPYQLYNGSIGIFLNGDFISGVTNQVNFVRAIYELSDLENSTNPLNFSTSASSSEFNISVGSINKQTFDSILFDGVNYYINLNENIPYISSNITYTFSVVRLSDSQELWDSGGTIVPGNPVKLILSGVGSPVFGEAVTIIYSFTINNLSRVIVDYNKGDYYVDYMYLADEIILSYEYGDNVLDFRATNSVPKNTEYYVSYKAGALRDALYRNFGNLVNIPELTTFDIDFDRERYREALMAALSSFIQGPTIPAIKNIGKIISHIIPEISESVFLGWSLGNSLLNPQDISTTGAFELLPAKFYNGVLVNSSDQTITFPINSNIKLEEGTFETWLIPQWSGIDNDAELTFNILQNNVAIDPSEVFIGAGEFHPTIVDGVFTIDKNSGADGYPNMNKDGVFIYYDQDVSGNFYRWYVRVVDGYVSSPSANYKIKITSPGVMYDSKAIEIPKPANMSIFTGTNSVTLNIIGGSLMNEGITFVCDFPHYLLDFGESALRNRVSLFKDSGGYLNFRVIDRDKIVYTVSADVSSWEAYDKHHIAISWKINTINSRDELHLFIDGFEVPNIIKYGQRPLPYLHENYRTVNPEEILGLSNRDIISSTDLSTIKDGYIVSSLIKFSDYKIYSGDKLFIDEIGFDSEGYTISSVLGQTLTLAQPMPLTLSNCRFSVNRTQYIVQSAIDIAPNIQVTRIGSFLTGSDLSGIIGSSTVTSAGTDFTTSGVFAGYYIRIDDPALPTTYLIDQVSGNSLTIDGELPVNLAASTFYIYSTNEIEIPGVRALRPSYSISKDGYYNNILTVSNSVFSDDLVLIRTLGLNNRRIRKQYYIWSDNRENILMTRLPAPISLDEVKIIKLILNDGYVSAIGPSNSTIIGGIFHSINFPCTQPSNSDQGRTISVTISGNNTDFSVPVQVTINGVSGIYTISETLSFTDYGTLDFTNPYISINYINVVAKPKPINPLKNALVIDVREKYSITHSEFSALVPEIRYSYQIGCGTTLYSTGANTVSDGYYTFSDLCVDNYLVVQSPIPAAGFYKILAVSSDKRTLTVEPTTAGPYPPSPLPTFTGGVYQILNVVDYRSGLQNGFFTLEAEMLPSIGYLLSHGFYELDYYTYARMKLDLPKGYVYLGSDLFGSNQINAIIDQVKIYSCMLTDTRIGEQITNSQRSITQDYNSLKPLLKDSNTLMLIDFNTYPFVNNADFYINTYSDKQYFHSSSKVNSNFTDSLAIMTEPMVLSNDGILDTSKQGTIEFWTSPLYDTGNDPVVRFYFDASSAIIEEAVSTDMVSVKISKPISQVLSVTLKAGDPSIDYFAGGKVEIDTQRATMGSFVSSSKNVVTTDLPILQVISVKIPGDYAGTDYFGAGSIGTDNKTIYLEKSLPYNNTTVVVTYQTTENNNKTLNTQIIRLNRKLPAQKSHVIVKYLPSGIQGDRIAIYKDEFGYINFGISASGMDYIVRAPTRWVRNTWHRVKASYKINGGIGKDEISLFLDGYQYDNNTSLLYGSGLLYGSSPAVYGSIRVGFGSSSVGNIRFIDPINTLYIGSQYTKTNQLFGLINNLRISNISRPIYAPYNEPLDVNYNSNLNVVYPVTSDLYTTYLQDSSSQNIKNEDFVSIVNRTTGGFDFSVNIIDSLGIIGNNDKVRNALEKLIRVLKPANSKVYIKYQI
jgi:hypothetical protein